MNPSFDNSKNVTEAPTGVQTPQMPDNNTKKPKPFHKSNTVNYDENPYKEFQESMQHNNSINYEPYIELTNNLQVDPTKQSPQIASHYNPENKSK